MTPGCFQSFWSSEWRWPWLSPSSWLQSSLNYEYCIPTVKLWLLDVSFETVSPRLGQLLFCRHKDFLCSCLLSPWGTCETVLWNCCGLFLPKESEAWSFISYSTVAFPPFLSMWHKLKLSGKRKHNWENVPISLPVDKSWLRIVWEGPALCGWCHPG